ncbi:hypothetical protein KUTeg_018677 [Tegillarca granosa]|uniref:Core-binding (CB) domain-containing protein n=1 Tax=Tegillarca granosa TaxID=220873 RepID=A0ABQ9EEI8_TEGGR|nr:hypothetical protein KUTeg_018677 [Tegillarca granosa]
MQCSLSINTKLSYQTVLQQFTNFRRFLKLPNLWPVPIDHLLFISYQSQKGLSPSTVSSYLAAISHVHKVYNWTNPTSQFLVQKAVTGLDSRAPVTGDMLHNIYNILETVCWSEYELWLFRSAYCLAFYGLLSVSELVYTTADMAHRPLFYSDIRVSTSGNQQGRSITLRIPAITGKSVCPVFSIKNFSSVRNRSDGILFIHEDGSPLTRYQFNAVLRKSIIKLGLPLSVFSSHSFRIGTATTLALKGLDPSIIQSLGRDDWILGSSFIYWACRMAKRLIETSTSGTFINYFVKALLRLDPRGRNLAMDVSCEVQGQNCLPYHQLSS